MSRGRVRFRHPRTEDFVPQRSDTGDLRQLGQRRTERISVVSLGVIEEVMESYALSFRGLEPVLAARAALAYAKSVERAQTGQVYRIA